jgi:hypothetical protein
MANKRGSTVLVTGDCNGSGAINEIDVPCFVNALLVIDTVPPGGIVRSDMDASGTADGLDVQFFVDALVP